MSSKYSAELFLEACGRTGPLQLSVDDTARPGPIRCVFHQPFLVVGRDPNADLHLDNWRVSRRHAYLQLVAGRLFCLDLGSRTGIQWADVANEAGWLDFGRTIRIGPYEIGRWSHALTPTPALALPEPHDFAGAAYQIEALTKTPLTSTTRVNLDLALVGRSSGCLVRLPYPDVSKAHCSLIRTPLGVWAVDLLGRGGIYVNESDVRFARLDDGDELRIGRHVLRFRLDEAIDANATVITTALPQLPRPMDDPSTSENPRPVRTLPVLPSPPSTSMAIVPTWQYPDGEIQRVLSDQPGSQAELIGQLMQPMVQQFGLMQQQMFEQFHHAMMGMFLPLLLPLLHLLIAPLSLILPQLLLMKSY